MTLTGMIPRDENSIRNIFKWWFGLFVITGTSIILLILCDYLLPIYQTPIAVVKTTKTPYHRCRSHCRRRWPRWVLLYNICLFIPTVICAAVLSYPSAHSDLTFARLGHVTDTTAALQFRSPECSFAKLSYQTGSDPKRNLTGNPNLGGDFVLTFPLDKLQPSSLYRVSYECGSHREALQFRTNPPVGNSSSFSFAFSSDWNNRRLGKVPYLPPRALRELRPNFFVFLGNFINADFPLSTGSDPDFYQRRYRNALANDELGAFFRETPSFSILGEHDVFVGFEKGATRLCNYNCYATSSDVAKIALNTFVSYMGGTNPAVYGGNFQYYEWDYGDVAFFALDTRQHRSPWRAADDSDKTMLGIIQKTRLQQWLLAKRDSAKFKLIFSEVGWTANFNAEHAKVNGRWSNYLTERAELVSFIRANGIRGVVLLSGGAHASYVVQINGSLFEFSASPLAFNDVTDFGSKGTVFLDEGPDQVMFQGGRVASFGESQFGLVSVDTTASPPVLSCDLYQVNAEGKNKVYTQRIPLN